MRGHIHKRQWNGRGGKTQTLWYVVVDVGQAEDGKRQQKWHGGFKTRRDAQNAMAEIVIALDRHTYVAPQRLTLTHFVRDQWLPMMHSQVKVSTWDSYSRNLKLHVLPVLGGRQMQAITVGHLNALYQSLLSDGNHARKGGLSPKTVRYIHTTLSKLLSDAVDLGLVARNVATSAKAPKAGKSSVGEMRFWTPEELDGFLGFVRADWLYPFWHLTAMTGMRRGEVLGLRWADIDLRLARLAVRQELISVAYEPIFSTPKSHRARVIDLDPETVKVLRQHRSDQRRARAATPASTRAKDLVFTRLDDGDLIHPDRLTQMFDLQVKRSGCPRIRFHDLRHTHATIGLRAGVPIKVMSERLGHSNPGFTLQQYAHVIPGMQAEAAAAIADLVRGNGKPASIDTRHPDDADDDCDERTRDEDDEGL
jgi:integrase